MSQRPGKSIGFERPAGDLARARRCDQALFGRRCIEMAPRPDTPPPWMPYVAAADCDTRADQAQRLGARLIAPPNDIPNCGRFAALQDAQDACIMKPAG